METIGSGSRRRSCSREARCVDRDCRQVTTAILAQRGQPVWWQSELAELVRPCGARDVRNGPRITVSCRLLDV